MVLIAILAFKNYADNLFYKNCFEIVLFYPTFQKLNILSTIASFHVTLSSIMSVALLFFLLLLFSFQGANSALVESRYKPL